MASSLSKEEKARKLAVAKEKKRRKAKDNLVHFLEYQSKGDWKRANHLELLCNKLEKVSQGLIRKLMVFMPPRHGKSEVVSKKFPAWYLSKHPSNEVIISSYSADLAYDFSRIARNTIRNQNVFDVKIASDSSAVKKWNLEGYRGGLSAAGVGGPITGRGANVAIIDDPFKNWEEASSEVIRDKVHNWYQTVLQTRLAPGGSIVLVMTRWHEDDLAGRLLEDEKSQWEVVEFPAIAKSNDILGRKESGALWPERYPVEELNNFRNGMLRRMWLSLYQQEPRKTEEGALWTYDMIEHIDNKPQMKRIVVAIDPATTSNKNSDKTGIIIAGLGVDNKGYVLEDRTCKASPHGWAKKAVNAYHNWEADRIVGEVNQGGDMVENTIRTIDKNVSYKEVRATRGKSIRAEPIAALYEQEPRKIFHVGEFVELEDQLTTWDPQTSTDSPNNLDALVWAFTELMLKGKKSAGTW